MTAGTIEVSLEAVIFAVTDNAPRFLTVAGPNGLRALPEGPLQREDPTLEIGLRRWIQDQAGLEVGYVEQLYTFGDMGRNTVDSDRLLSVAYLALVREGLPSAGAAWVDVYDFFPWEDHRHGPPAVIAERILPALARYARDAPNHRIAQERAERTQIMFGQGGAVFDAVRALERYELLYEAGLVREAELARPNESPVGTGGDDPSAGLDDIGSQPMYLDHRRIAATALSRLRGKLTYRPVVFELLPSRFTLSRLQKVVESLAGVGLHKQNFRRLVEAGGLVEGTGEMASTGGRPAELFRFRREVLRERPRPGISSVGYR